MFDASTGSDAQDALFAGHDDGAENWAIVGSLIETAKISGIDPQAWLTDALARLVNFWHAVRDEARGSRLTWRSKFPALRLRDSEC